jgi:CheY-like chemotaxis protein
MARVLVIDDSSFQRKSICEIIKSAGYETQQAKNGEDALEQLKDTKFDCIFCDLLMPKLDGIGFLKIVKAQDLETPVVILSADKQSTTRVTVLELGAKKMLNKPPNVDEITSILTEILA